jgi:hypothetical protein
VGTGLGRQDPALTAADLGVSPGMSCSRVKYSVRPSGSAAIVTIGRSRAGR